MGCLTQCLLPLWFREQLKTSGMQKLIEQCMETKPLSFAVYGVIKVWLRT